MAIPDPETFLNHPCVIKLKDGQVLHKTILRIDISGVTVQDDYGLSRTYRFGDIALVHKETP